VQQRLARIRDDAARNKADPAAALGAAQAGVETLIDERVLVTNARETGARVDDPEIDRAVLNVATQNQMTLPQLRERLRQEGIPSPSSARTFATRSWSSGCASARS
jgi:peptidyl-prolyl cis-trans isomerase SurA